MFLTVSQLVQVPQNLKLTIQNTEQKLYCGGDVILTGCRGGYVLRMGCPGDHLACRPPAR